jgi:hypothetical protein
MGGQQSGREHPDPARVFARVRDFIRKYPHEVAAVARVPRIVVDRPDDSEQLERRLDTHGYRRVVGTSSSDPIAYVLRTHEEQVAKDALNRDD